MSSQIRPQSLQELRPQSQNRKEAGRRGIRGGWQGASCGDCHGARESCSERRILHQEKAVPECRFLFGSDLQGHGIPDRLLCVSVHDSCKIKYNNSTARNFIRIQPYIYFVEYYILFFLEGIIYLIKFTIFHQYFLF